MKKLFIAQLLFIISTSLFAGKGYLITQKYLGQSKSNITVTWYVTDVDCKLKMVFGDGTVNSTTYFIPDTKRSVILTYNDGAVPAGVQRSYFIIPVEKIQQGKESDVSRITVTQTGETKTIGGLKCEKVMVRTNRNETEVWLSKDFKPQFYKFATYFRDNLALAGLNEEHLKGFPMEYTTKDLEGKVISSYQFISAEQKDLNETDFTVPAEYKSPSQITNSGKN